MVASGVPPTDRRWPVSRSTGRQRPRESQSAWAAPTRSFPRSPVCSCRNTFATTVSSTDGCLRQRIRSKSARATPLLHRASESLLAPATRFPWIGAFARPTSTNSPTRKIGDLCALISQADSQVAAIARSCGMAVATRNVRVILSHWIGPS